METFGKNLQQNFSFRYVIHRCLCAPRGIALCLESSRDTLRRLMSSLPPYRDPTTKLLLAPQQYAERMILPSVEEDKDDAEDEDEREDVEDNESFVSDVNSCVKKHLDFEQDVDKKKGNKQNTTFHTITIDADLEQKAFLKASREKDLHKALLKYDDIVKGGKE